MTLSIIQTSLYAKHLLDSHPYGYVHSVYRKTINLSFGRMLLALQAEGSPLSPISLITRADPAHFGALPVKEGDFAAGSSQGIQIKAGSGDPISFLISEQDCQFYDLRITDALPPGHIHRVRQEAETLVRNSDTGGFDMLFKASTPTLPLHLQVAKAKIENCMSHYQKQDFQSAAEALRGLIGLGTGLTPSGDDFLCGVLAAISLTGAVTHPFSRALSEKISSHLQDTNPISSAFLSCALAGQSSLAVKKLAKGESIRSCAEAFHAIGHSSGIDSLCGIYFYLITTDME